MGRVKAIWEPCMFRGRPPVPLRKVANKGGGIFGFSHKETGVKSVTMAAV